MREKSDNQKSLSIFQQNRFVWTVYVLSIVILAVLTFVPRDKVVYNIKETFESFDDEAFFRNYAKARTEPKYKTITIQRPWFRKSILGFGLFCFIMLCVFQGPVLRYKHIRQKIFNIIN